jgi:hypothetical protein
MNQSSLSWLIHGQTTVKNSKTLIPNPLSYNRVYLRNKSMVMVFSSSYLLLLQDVSCMHCHWNQQICTTELTMTARWRTLLAWTIEAHVTTPASRRRGQGLGPGYTTTRLSRTGLAPPLPSARAPATGEACRPWTAFGRCSRGLWARLGTKGKKGRLPWADPRGLR